MARKKSRGGRGLLNYRARMTLWSVVLVLGVFGYFFYSAPQFSGELTGMATADCHEDVLGGSAYCSPDCLCYAGEGDCDSDSDCVPGTVCVSNVGESYGYEPRVDVCMILD